MFQYVPLKKLDRTKAIERISRSIRCFIREEGPLKSIYYIEELDAILIANENIPKKIAIKISQSIEQGDLF